MKRHFQILIEGQVRSSPDEATAEARLAEMKQAVTDSFKPDLQWGVTYDTFDVLVLEATRKQ